jgi:hypothetical protein
MMTACGSSNKYRTDALLALTLSPAVIYCRGFLGDLHYPRFIFIFGQIFPEHPFFVRNQKISKIMQNGPWRPSPPPVGRDGKLGVT